DDGTILKLGEGTGQSPEAKLFIDLGELWIERMGETPIEMIRGTRKRMLKPAQPMRVLLQDKICMGASECLVQKICRLNSGDALISRFGKMSNKVKIFGAAAAMMVVIPACNPAAHAGGKRIRCFNGNAMCLNNNRYQCDDFRWKLLEQCQAPASCEFLDKKTTICENSVPCENGRYICFGNAIYECENHQWEIQKDCGCCKECELISDTEARCVKADSYMGKPVFGNECKERYKRSCGRDNAIQICDDGYLYYEEVCAEPEICKETPEGGAICVKPEDTE
ncbi:MAG: hypothetical protein IJU23_08290, partial [Proteobacteria bacterium]|nr:hypothetical protein [Pseudomonadota bacterium]